MNLNSFGFLVRECFLNVRRNGLMSLAALGTVVVSLTVLGASLWTAYRIHEIVQEQPKKFDQISVFLKPETPRLQTMAVQERIRHLSGVKTVHLIIKEVAWSRMQDNERTLTEAMPINPLPDAFEVEPANAGDVEALNRIFQDKAQFPEVVETANAAPEVKAMLGFVRVVKIIGGGAGIGLFIATLFIVYNTIRLTVFARRREIRIMQLVGATPAFIRFPLLLEGLFHGIVGAAVAGGLLLVGGREISAFITGLHSPLVGDVPSQVTPLIVFTGLGAIGAFVGIVGSYLSMRRFLRQI